MTTPLVRPLTREILISGAAYRVTLAADRLTLTPKGRRKGAIEITWDELLTWRGGDADAEPRIAQSKAMPPSILTEVATELRKATDAIGRADATLVQAGALPAELKMEMGSDPAYGRAERAEDWFIEPLLTEREVASVLRLSTRAVRRLPIRTIVLGGETRYRQSAVRQFLNEKETPQVRW